MTDILNVREGAREMFFKENEVDSETKVKEQPKSEIYPIKLTIVNKIGNGIDLIENEFVSTKSAIKISVDIDRSDYYKEEVLISLKEACQQLLEYYC